MQPKVIAVAAIKGGVGKSTLAWALGTFLAEHGRVLLWDCDPQATLTSAVASDFTRTAHDVLIGSCTVAEARIPALPRYGTNLSIVPAGSTLAGLEAATAGELDRQYKMADAHSRGYGHPNIWEVRPLFTPRHVLSLLAHRLLHDAFSLRPRNEFKPANKRNRNEMGLKGNIGPIEDTA